MAEVYLLIGGNLGNRFLYLREATQQIKSNIGKILNFSALYETEPFGFTDESQFLNQCLWVETSKSPRDLLKIISSIETSLGRIRTGIKYSSRTIDIDILFYEGMIIEEPGLIIPHPEFHKRNFALIPMSEINPQFIHPVFKKSVQQLLKECDDQHRVVKLACPI